MTGGSVTTVYHPQVIYRQPPFYLLFSSLASSTHERLGSETFDPQGDGVSRRGRGRQLREARG